MQWQVSIIFVIHTCQKENADLVRNRTNLSHFCQHSFYGTGLSCLPIVLFELLTQGWFHCQTCRKIRWAFQAEVLLLQSFFSSDIQVLQRTGTPTSSFSKYYFSLLILVCLYKKELQTDTLVII